MANPTWLPPWEDPWEAVARVALKPPAPPQPMPAPTPVPQPETGGLEAAGRRALDYLQAPLNVFGAGTGAILGAGLKAFGNDAYERALAQRAEAFGAGPDAGLAQSLAIAPPPGTVLAEALAPGTPETAVGRIAKNVGSLGGDILLDPSNWATGGIAAARGLGRFAATGARNVDEIAPLVQAVRGGGLDEAARLAQGMSRGKAAALGLEAGLGSATAGLLYAPDIALGTLDSARAAKEAYDAGDYGTAAEMAVQAGLTGGLGGLMLRGVRNEARALRQPPAATLAAPEGVAPEPEPGVSDFDQDFGAGPDVREAAAELQALLASRRRPLDQDFGADPGSRMGAERFVLEPDEVIPPQRGVERADPVRADMGREPIDVAASKAPRLTVADLDQLIEARLKRLRSGDDEGAAARAPEPSPRPLPGATEPRLLASGVEEAPAVEPVSNPYRLDSEAAPAVPSGREFTARLTGADELAPAPRPDEPMAGVTVRTPGQAPKPGQRSALDVVPEPQRASAREQATRLGRSIDPNRADPDIVRRIEAELPDDLKPHAQAIATSAFNRAVARYMGNEALGQARADHGDAGPDGLSIEGQTGNSFDVVQRAGGKVVGVANVRGNKLSMIAGGREMGSPVSVRPVYAEVDRRGVERTDSLTEFGAETRERYEGKSDVADGSGRAVQADSGEAVREPGSVAVRDGVLGEEEGGNRAAAPEDRADSPAEVEGVSYKVEVTPDARSVKVYYRQPGAPGWSFLAGKHAIENGRLVDRGDPRREGTLADAFAVFKSDPESAMADLQRQVSEQLGRPTDAPAEVARLEAPEPRAEVVERPAVEPFKSRDAATEALAPMRESLRGQKITLDGAKQTKRMPGGRKRDAGEFRKQAEEARSVREWAEGRRADIEARVQATESLKRKSASQRAGLDLARAAVKELDKLITDAKSAATRMGGLAGDTPKIARVDPTVRAYEEAKATPERDRTIEQRRLLGDVTAAKPDDVVDGYLVQSVPGLIKGGKGKVNARDQMPTGFQGAKAPAKQVARGIAEDANNKDYLAAKRSMRDTLEEVGPNPDDPRNHPINQLGDAAEPAEGDASFNPDDPNFQRPKRALTPDTRPSEIPDGVMAAVARKLRAQGYDVRSTDDARALIERRGGGWPSEDWKAAYESVLASRDSRTRNTAQQVEATPHVNWKLVRGLGLTSDPRQAGYVNPRGGLLNLSGGGRGERGLDHRIVGGTAGMQELIHSGYVRWMPESNGLDIGKLPTNEQFSRIRDLAERADGEVVIDLADGIGTFDTRNEWYGDPKRRAYREYPAGTKASRIIGDIRRFYQGEDIESGMAFQRPAPGQRGMFVDDVAPDAPKKAKPRQTSMFGGREMLVPSETRVTEGREADGPLFKQDEDARARAEKKAQKPLFQHVTEAEWNHYNGMAKPERDRAYPRIAKDAEAIPGSGLKVADFEGDVPASVLDALKGTGPLAKALGNVSRRIGKLTGIAVDLRGFGAAGNWNGLQASGGVWLNPLRAYDRAQGRLETRYSNLTGKAAERRLNRLVASSLYETLTHEVAHYKIKAEGKEHLRAQREIREILAGEKKRVIGYIVRSLETRNGATRGTIVESLRSALGEAAPGWKQGEARGREAAGDGGVSSGRPGRGDAAERSGRGSAEGDGGLGARGGVLGRGDRADVRRGGEEPAEGLRAASEVGGDRVSEVLSDPKREGGDRDADDSPRPASDRSPEAPEAEAYPLARDGREAEGQGKLSFERPTREADLAAPETDAAAVVGRLRRESATGKKWLQLLRVRGVESEPLRAWLRDRAGVKVKRSEILDFLAPVDREKGADGYPSGRPPMVNERVEGLRKAEKGAGVPPADLDRDTKAKWEDMDESIRAMLRTMSDEDFYGIAKRRQLDAGEVQAWAARVAGKNERMLERTVALREARESGGDVERATRDQMEAMLDFIAAERMLVNDGTGTARALAARARLMRADRTDDDAFLRSLFKSLPRASDAQVADIMRAWREDPDAVPDLLRAAIGFGRVDKALELWKAGLLSAWSTDIANITGNAGEAGARIAEGALAAGMDRLLSLFKGTTRARRLEEARAEVSGLLDIFPSAAASLLANLRGIVKKGDKWLPDKPVEPTGRWEFQVGAVGGRLGRVARTSFRKLEVEDKFFKDLASASVLRKLATREARKALGANATPDAIRKRASEIVAEALDPESGKHVDLLKEVEREKLSRTFQDDPGRLANDLMRMARDNKIAAVVFPFIKTPANILKVTLQRSPLGYGEAKRRWDAWQKAIAEKAPESEIQKLQGEAADAIARPLMGTVLLTGFGALAAAGAMTGGGPVDEREQRLLRDAGWQPYSFVLRDPVSGARYYIPFNRFEPVSTMLGYAADMVETAQQKKAGDMLDKALGSLASNMVNKTYLQGLSDAANLISKPSRFASRYVSNLVGSVVPNIVARAARATDSTLRDTTPERTGLAGLPERAVKTVVSRIPGASRLLPARSGGTGEPVERQGSIVSRFLSPVQVSKEEPGSVERELVGIDYAPSAPSRDVKIARKNVRMNDAEYQILLRYRRKAAEQVRNVTKLASYQRRDEEARRKIVQDIFRKYGDRARQVAVPKVRARVLRERQVQA